MKILLVSGPGISLQEPFNSGIEAFMVSFASALIKEGHDVDVVAEEMEESSGFKLINPFTESSPHIPDYLTKLKEKEQFKKLEAEHYDLIHFNMFYPHLLKAGMYFKKPVFLTLHSPADAERVTVYKELSQRSDFKFVAISKRIKTQWDEALGLDIPLINNGIDLKFWPLKNPGHSEFLLWSARITEEKNAAAAISLAQHMNLPLKIAGRIVDQHYFDEQVKPQLNSQIEYLGHLTQRELSSLAKKASAYLATATWQEPFGLAALEMLASGVPVVGFNTAVPQSWEHESVLTTASLDWKDLVELIKKSSTVLPKTCKEFASSMTIQKMTSDYLKLYEEVLSKQNEDSKLISKDDSLSLKIAEKMQSL